MNYLIIDNYQSEELKITLQEIIQNNDYIKLKDDKLSLADLIAQVSTFSFFGHSYIIYYHNQLITVDNLDLILSSMAENKSLILVENQIDKRSSLYKLLAKKFEVIEIEILNYKNQKLYLNQLLKKAQINLSSKTKNKFLQNVKMDKSYYQHQVEIIKLLANHLDLIDESIVTKLEIDGFKLVDNLIQKKHLMVNKFVEGINHEQELFIANNFIYNYSKLLYLIKTSDLSDVNQSLKLNPTYFKNLLAKSQKVEISLILKILKSCLEIDYQFKNFSLDKKLIFTSYLIKAIS